MSCSSVPALSILQSIIRNAPDLSKPISNYIWQIYVLHLTAWKSKPKTNIEGRLEKLRNTSLRCSFLILALSRRSPSALQRGSCRSVPHSSRWGALGGKGLCASSSIMNDSRSIKLRGGTLATVTFAWLVFALVCIDAAEVCLELHDANQVLQTFAQFVAVCCGRLRFGGCIESSDCGALSARQAGTSNKINALENTIPKARLMAIGIRNCAWMLVSEIIGKRPMNVVNVVIKIGLNRRRTASRILWIRFPPFRSSWLK